MTMMTTTRPPIDGDRQRGQQKKSGHRESVGNKQTAFRKQEAGSRKQEGKHADTKEEESKKHEPVQGDYTHSDKVHRTPFSPSTSWDQPFLLFCGGHLLLPLPTLYTLFRHTHTHAHPRTSTHIHAHQHTSTHINAPCQPNVILSTTPGRGNSDFQRQPCEHLHKQILCHLPSSHPHSAASSLRSASRNFANTSMAATPRPSIFNVPELVGLVAQYLSNHDVAQCMTTCKAWTPFFEPYIWRHIKLNSSYPTPQALALNRHRIRSLSVASDDFANLRTLASDLPDTPSCEPSQEPCDSTSSSTAISFRICVSSAWTTRLSMKRMTWTMMRTYSAWITSFASSIKVLACFSYPFHAIS